MAEKITQDVHVEICLEGLYKGLELCNNILKEEGYPMKIQKCKICGKQITRDELNPNNTEEELKKIDTCCKCAVASAFDTIPL